MTIIGYVDQWGALRLRYSNAHIEPYDAKVLALTKAGWNAMHREFHFWLGETYRKEVGDCDDFMREFHAYVKRRHRAGDKETALGCYDLIYKIGGPLGQKHAINAVWVVDDGVPYLSEFEPQPGGGLFECTEKELDTVSYCLG